MKGSERRMLRPRHASPRARGAAPLAAAAAPRGLVRSTCHSQKARRDVAVFRSVVMEYWKRSGRDHLPWRQTRDPYRILVSEMMLQQTQVDRVIPYYERFLKRFPDAGTLAAASLSEVLRLWSGLGYNRRAKYLHDASKQLAMLSLSYSNKIAYEDLRKLPGVGDYTAKAVRVFAWNEPEVLIETNVRAAFINHFFPRCRTVSDARLLPLVAEALRGQDPRTWYAALMDYGTYLKATRPNPSRKSRHHVKQSRFEGSLRQMRGAILRAVARGEDPAACGRGADPRFAEAYERLHREGLLDGT